MQIDPPKSTESKQRACIIGAGPSGLTAIKNLRKWGIETVCFDRNDRLGGNWYFDSPHASIYESTHLISSTKMTEYRDFPFPKGTPAYPHHLQVLSYLNAYADHFDLRPHIQFETTIESVTAKNGGTGKSASPDERRRAGWTVVRRSPSGDQITEDFDILVVANGHHSVPRKPEWPGEFNGEIIHSHEYKSARQLLGKSVLVVGAGNSGCDIAVEAGRQAKQAFLSVRRGYHFVPKFIGGKPSDQQGDRLNRMGVPIWLQRHIASFTTRLAMGKGHHFGLPKPDHKLFEYHPIVNSELLYVLGHGRLKACADVAKLCGDEVEFKDGLRQQIDLIVMATGYEPVIPFLDEKLVFEPDGSTRLYLNAYSPDRDDLLVAGLIQANGGQWCLTDLQCDIYGAYISAANSNEASRQKVADAFRQKKAGGWHPVSAGIHFADSPRHKLEVEYSRYKILLEKWIKRFEREVKRAA